MSLTEDLSQGEKVADSDRLRADILATIEEQPLNVRKLGQLAWKALDSHMTTEACRVDKGRFGVYFDLYWLAEGALLDAHQASLTRQQG